MKFKDWIASRSAATLASGDELYVRDASGDVSQRTTYGALTAVADAHIADATDAHDASAVSITDAAGNYTATDVEGALAELPSQYAPLAIDQFVDPFPAWFGGGTVNDGVADIVTHMDAYVGVGSGAPNGVVTGNVGDRYIDTAATTGARVWYKDSGTATNTGWLVTEGDTGWRNVVADILTGYTATNIRIRRINREIHVTWDGLAYAGASNPSEASFYTMPTGFTPDGLPTTRGFSMRASGSTNWWYYMIAGNDLKAGIRTGSNTSADTFRGMLSFVAASAWPTSLPGSAA